MAINYEVLNREFEGYEIHVSLIGGCYEAVKKGALSSDLVVRGDFGGELWIGSTLLFVAGWSFHSSMVPFHLKRVMERAKSWEGDPNEFVRKELARW
jgi:hypothetical protein